jgi:enterochelin esterase-like enzyme
MRHAWAAWLGLVLLATCAPAADRVPEPVRRATDTGWIDRVQAFPSRFVIDRAVEVWLPPDSLWDGRPLPVIYLHDGQNLFDASSSFIGVDWGVDSTLASLVDGGFCAPALLVGIANTERRRREYTPESLLGRLPGKQRREFRREVGGSSCSRRLPAVSG